MKKNGRTSLGAWAAAAAVAAVALLALGGTAVAGHLTSEPVKSYTGCLDLGTARTGPIGTIQLIAEGDAPRRACPAGHVEAHFSGGDITKISATGGLTVDGENGNVTIGLDPSYSLPQNCNAPNNVAKWNGTAWACAADNDTTYSNGTGLALSGTQFSVASDYRVKNTPDCSSGQFATGFDASGNITCGAPAAPPGPEVWTTSGTGNAPEGSNNTIATLSLPAGSYLVHVTGTARDDTGGDNDMDVLCALRPSGHSTAATSDTGTNQDASFAITGVVQLASAASVYVECRSFTGSDNAAAYLTAVKVGTVH